MPEPASKASVFKRGFNKVISEQRPQTAHVGLQESTIRTHTGNAVSQSGGRPGEGSPRVSVRRGPQVACRSPDRWPLLIQQIREEVGGPKIPDKCLGDDIAGPDTTR